MHIQYNNKTNCGSAKSWLENEAHMFQILYTKFQHDSNRNVVALKIWIVEHCEKHNYEKNEGKVLVLYFNCMKKSMQPVRIPAFLVVFCQIW